MNAAPFLLAMEALKASAVLGFPALFGFPAPDAAPVWAVMYLAFGIRRFFRRRSVRYLAIALAEAAALAAVIAAALRWGPGASARGPDWALIASCALALWRALWLEAKYEAAGGAASGSGGAAVHALCAARFDEGVVLFAALLMLSSFLHIEGGAAARAAPVFVVAAIAAIRTAARGGGRPSGAARDARSSAGARGVIAGIAAGAGTFMLAAWALARGLPAARESARDAGLFVLRIAMALLEAIVRFLSALIRPAPLAPRPEEERMARTGAEAFAEQGNSLLGTIMMWLMGLLIAAAVIALIAYLLVKLAVFLRRKTPAAPAGAARARPARPAKRPTPTPAAWRSASRAPRAARPPSPTRSACSATPARLSPATNFAALPRRPAASRRGASSPKDSAPRCGRPCGPSCGRRAAGVNESRIASFDPENSGRISPASPRPRRARHPRAARAPRTPRSRPKAPRAAAPPHRTPAPCPRGRALPRWRARR